MGWNRDSIRERMEKNIPENLSADEYRQRLIDLSVAIYPVISVFSSIDDSPRGTWFTSMLFPWDCESEGFTDHTHHMIENGKWIHENPTPSEIHLKGYETAESISIGYSGKPHSVVNDDFIFLQSYDEFAGGHAYNGSISAGDVRYLTESYQSAIKKES